MSAGEKQRLALARALLCHTRVLIIDEVSDHLDFEATQKVIANLCALAGTRTILFTSHLMTPLALVPQIFLLANGSISEAGSFDELRQKGERFAKMLERESPRCHLL